MTIKLFSKKMLPHSFFQTFLPPFARRFATIGDPACACVISQKKIEKCLMDRQIDSFQLEMRECHVSKNFHNKWDQYQVEVDKEAGVSHCKAFKVLRTHLPPALLEQSNVKKLDPDSLLVESHLSVLSSEPGKVTLAGEGGRHVGRKEYWGPILDRLKMYKNKPVYILSIGGGIGYESLAILNVFKKDGFLVQKPVIVDPNQLASFLCEEEVDYYVTTSQRFFKDFFIKEDGSLYIIHLGTTLNVVQENDAVQILEQIVDKMEQKDALSILMVDKKQFRDGRFLTFGVENKQGLSKVIYETTGKHYKTVITDENKFINYMASLGLRGELLKISEKGVALNVAFVAFKALKDDN